MPARAKAAAAKPARKGKSSPRKPASASLVQKQLTELREQQAATAEILRVISRSRTDAQPVFDAIAASALRLCAASSANVFTYDGALIHLASLVNLTPAGRGRHQAPLAAAA